MTRFLAVCALICFLTIGIFGASKAWYTVLPYNCVGCADCIDVCSKGVIEIKRGKAVIDTRGCIGCAQCAYICSYNSIRKCEEK